MEHFFLSPYTAAHVGMLIHPLLTVSVAASIGTQAAAGEPTFDAGWSATAAPVTESDTLGLMIIHYLAHNLLWLLHLWRALHPDQHPLVVPYAALWSLLGIGFLTNLFCVLPAAAHDTLGLTYRVDWMFTPVVTYASSFLLTRVCWSWLVCAHIASVGADWRVKTLLAAWLVVDITTLLVLRVATLPALVITLLTAAWANRRFKSPGATTGATTQYSDVDAEAPPPPPAAAAQRRSKKQAALVADSESDDDDDGAAGRSAVFVIGDATDDIDERQRRRRRQEAKARRGSNISI
jgi:hypothetical protein